MAALLASANGLIVPRSRPQRSFGKCRGLPMGTAIENVSYNIIMFLSMALLVLGRWAVNKSFKNMLRFVVVLCCVYHMFVVLCVFTMCPWAYV